MYETNPFHYLNYNEIKVIHAVFIFISKVELLQSVDGAQAKGLLMESAEVTCLHKDEDGVIHFASGMCRHCYVEYAKISGGQTGGEDPPAFKVRKGFV